MCNTDENMELEVEHVNLLHRKRVDGLIAMPVGQDAAHYQEWLEKGIPLVLLDRCFDELKVPSVVVDNYAGAYEAVSYLLTTGHRRIAFIGEGEGSQHHAIWRYVERERLSAYLDTMEKYNLPLEERSKLQGRTEANFGRGVKWRRCRPPSRNSRVLVSLGRPEFRPPLEGEVTRSRLAPGHTGNGVGS